MTLEILSVLPRYERAHYEPETGKPLPPMFPTAARWASLDDPPAIGARIIVTINNCGPAIVTGYFVQDGFLGLACTLLDAPEWHKVQNNGNPAGHVFGPEFRMQGPEAHALAICDYWARVMGDDFHPDESLAEGFAYAFALGFQRERWPRDLERLATLRDEWGVDIYATALHALERAGLLNGAGNTRKELERAGDLKPRD